MTVSSFRLHLEGGAELENGADDRVGDEADEGEDGQQDPARDDAGEEVQLARDAVLVGGCDFLERRYDVAGVLADGELVEDQVREAVGPVPRLRQGLSLEDTIGGRLEGRAVDAVGDLATGHA